MRLVGTMQPCRRSVVKTPSIKNITPSWPCSDRLPCNSPSTTWNSEWLVVETVTGVSTRETRFSFLENGGVIVSLLLL